MFNTVRSDGFAPTLLASKLYKILFVQLSRFDDTILETQTVSDKSLPVLESWDTSKIPHVSVFWSEPSSSRNHGFANGMLFSVEHFASKVRRHCSRSSGRSRQIPPGFGVSWYVQNAPCERFLIWAFVFEKSRFCERNLFSVETFCYKGSTTLFSKLRTFQRNPSRFRAPKIRPKIAMWGIFDQMHQVREIVILLSKNFPKIQYRSVNSSKDSLIQDVARFTNRLGRFV